MADCHAVADDGRRCGLPAGNAGPCRFDLDEADEYHTPEYILEYVAEQVGVDPEVLRPE